MENQDLYWTARNTSGHKWKFEDGWNTPELAQKAAKFYRKEFRRKCVVVFVPKGQDHRETLRKQLAG